jgi:hypothetical protein
MALYYPGCADSIVDPSNSDCPVKELGDIRSLFLVKNSYTFSDITNTAEWTTAIEARNVFVFPYTRGSLAQAANEQPGFGDSPTTIDSYEFTLKGFDPNYASNWPFWNSINKSKNYKAGYRTETKVHLSTNAAQINAMAPIAEGDKKAAVLWDIEFKFVQVFSPRPYDMPDGVFDRAIAL